MDIVCGAVSVTNIGFALKNTLPPLLSKRTFYFSRNQLTKLSSWSIMVTNILQEICHRETQKLEICKL